jgi:hypothetical protein
LYRLYWLCRFSRLASVESVLNDGLVGGLLSEADALFISKGDELPFDFGVPATPGTVEESSLWPPLRRLTHGACSLYIYYDERPKLAG